LENKKNRKKLEVGSECLENFSGISYNRAEHDLKIFKRERESMALDRMLYVHSKIQAAFAPYFKKKHQINNLWGWEEDCRMGRAYQQGHIYREYLDSVATLRDLDNLIRIRSAKAVDILLEEARKYHVDVDPETIYLYSIVIKNPKQKKSLSGRRKRVIF
jgi:hypothetical protein